MKVAELGLLIDGCRDRGGCDISESRASVAMSGLNADDAKIIMNGVIELGWRWIGVDASETEFQEDSLIDDLGPFRIVLTKPPLPSGHVGVLTVRGFEQMLESSIDVGVWRIATLLGDFATYSSYFTRWETHGAFRELSPLTMKSPRKFVRDFTEPRKVVSDIRPWLLREGAWDGDDAMFKAWASRAARASLYALFDEVEADPVSVVLRGPPRRSVPVPANDLLEVIGKEGFDRLQEAAVWVYEMASETEMRHPLMSAELSRLFVPVDATLASLRTQLVSAIEGAKTAYQLGMSKLSSDTLKMLTDLRKSVMDEASKVSDATRQLVATVATALSVGIGLVAARVAAGAGGPLVGAVTVVIAAYVLAAIWAGHKSIKLQNDVRAQWKSRTYGFMATTDYEELVDGPAIKAANLFYSVAWAATFLVATLFIVVVWVITIPLNK